MCLHSAFRPLPHARARPDEESPGATGGLGRRPGAFAAVASPGTRHTRRLWPPWLLAAPLLALGPLRDHALASEDADARHVLLVADRLDGDAPAVALRPGLVLAQTRRLAVDGVPVEGRRHVPERFDLQVRDRLTRHVRHAHAEQQ